MSNLAGYTYSHEGPECPYCGRQHTADDGHYYDEYNYTEQECDGCEKTFKVEVCLEASWTCHPIEPSLTSPEHSPEPLLKSHERTPE